MSMYIEEKAFRQYSCVAPYIDVLQCRTKKAKVPIVRAFDGKRLYFTLCDCSLMPAHNARAARRIIVSPDPAVLPVGGTMRFTATGVAPDGTMLSLVELKWSVEGEIGEIDSRGVFVALAPGKGRVKASAPIWGRKATGYADVVVRGKGVPKRFPLPKRPLGRRKPGYDIIPVEPMPPSEPTPVRFGK